ncbi:hypothetical protein HK407_05g09640 [Ordospora pajunii]|uniref:uncharacterized protein n=1 Tax=Ordospora pajunii TaxID=3039483 RepID=UPI002952661D|nr:uncharacterized protein HK407_05g09640 [Ordospora pajunii]KAH9411445.1 hypothetical protein HK407_05g09640 [Ordospora pajunii]
MCEKVTIIEKGDVGCVDAVVHGCSCMHVVFERICESKRIEEMRFECLRGMHERSVKIFEAGRRIEFGYEFLIEYVLMCAGIIEYECKVDVLEEVGGACLLKGVLHAIDDEYRLGLSVQLNGNDVMVEMGGKVIYEMREWQ